MVICGTDLLSSLLPYVHILSSSSSSTYCSQCLNLFNDLKRCSKCHLISYCSISCQQKDWIYHKYECSSLHQLIDEYDLIRLFLRLILRYKIDHGIENSSTKRSFNDLQTHENEIRHDKRRLMIFQLISQYLKQCNLFDQFDENILFQLFCGLVINTLTIHDPIDFKSIGYGLYFDATIYNHSCLPTCHTIFNGISLTIRTICDESNDPWTINYIDLLESYQIRQEFLRENYYFNCQCKRCLKNDPNELIFLEKIHFEEQQMDKFINKNEFFNAYQSSKNLIDYYNNILPYYHAYLSLQHVKHLKLELFLAETISDLILQSTMKTTYQRVRISLGENHPLTKETLKLCEEYKLEMAMKQKEIN
jgi:SET and MYND domain-containing protein